LRNNPCFLGLDEARSYQWFNNSEYWHKHCMYKESKGPSHKPNGGEAAKDVTLRLNPKV